MKLTTCQISKTKSLQAEGWVVVDITVKSGIKAFAPTWDMVMGYKNGKLSEEEYTEMYFQLMRASFVNSREAWKAILGEEKVALACYCRKGNFCHRTLLQDILLKVAQKWGIQVELVAEK